MHPSSNVGGEERTPTFCHVWGLRLCTDLSLDAELECDCRALDMIEIVSIIVERAFGMLIRED